MGKLFRFSFAYVVASAAGGIAIFLPEGLGYITGEYGLAAEGAETLLLNLRDIGFMLIGFSLFGILYAALPALGIGLLARRRRWRGLTPFLVAGAMGGALPMIMATMYQALTPIPGEDFVWFFPALMVYASAGAAAGFLFWRLWFRRSDGSSSSG